MVQKVSGWVTFKFSLPKQDSEKTNHKELELAFRYRTYAHSNIIPLQILQQQSPQIIESALLQKRFGWDEHTYSCLPNCSKQSTPLDPSMISLYIMIDENY